MSFKILTAHGADAMMWDDLANRLPPANFDPMFTAPYARIQELMGAGEAYAAVYQWEKYFVLQPFMLRATPLAISANVVVANQYMKIIKDMKIDESMGRVDPSGTKFDMTSFYGGGGPVSNMNGWSRGPLWEWFDLAFSKWRQENSVVCEYAQLHIAGAIDAVKMMKSKEQPIRVKDAVVMKLGTDAEMLAAVSETRRKTIHAGIRGGLEAHKIGPANGMDRFFELYSASMERKDATDFWRMPREYFSAHFGARGVGDTGMIAVDLGGFITSMAIVIAGGRYAHYQFAASIDRPPQGSSDLCIMEAARFARDAGSEFLHLGGGATSSEDDTLLWYKAGFSKLVEPVFLVRRIFDTAAYQELCTAAKTKANDISFFPSYRRAVA